MAYRVLLAQITSHGYVVKVHLDETKLNQWDEPDPAYVREWTWGIDPPAKAIHDADGKLIPEEKRQFHTEAEYMELLKTMIAEHVTSELSMLGEETDKPRASRTVTELLSDRKPTMQAPRALIGKAN